MSTSFIYPTPPRRHLCAALLAALLAAPGAHAAMCGSTPYPNSGPCYGTAPDYTVTIESGDTVKVWAVGHYSGAGDNVSGGHVRMTGGTAHGGVYGGMTTGSNGSATGNTVEISGDAKVWGNGVVGGWASGSGEATSNTVTLRGGSAFANLYGGDSVGSGDVVKDNTLNVVNVKGLNVGTYFANFDTLNFTLPDTITNGDTILTASIAIFPATTTKVDIKVTGSPALNVGDTINLISAINTLTITLPSTPTIISAGGVDYFSVEPKGSALVATVLAVPDALNVSGSTPQGGEVKCDHAQVLKHIGTTTCTAVADTGAGYTFDVGSMTVSIGTGQLINCNGNTCTLANVTSDVTVTGVFKLPPPPGSATAVPTLGGAGLALTALALPAFAAPALRRRRKQGKKADTLR